MKQENTNEMTFEGALQRLESLVHTLEEGNADLEASLTAFEEGISLVKFCTEKLTNAEQKVKILLAESDGIVSVPFEE